MNISWNRTELEKLTPESRQGMEAHAQAITADANRSSGGNYYAWRWNKDGTSINIFRGTKRAFLVEFGTSAIQGGRHLKKTLDRRRVS